MNEWLFNGDWSGIPIILITLIMGMALFTVSFVVASRFAKKFTPHYIMGITVGVLMAIISMNSKICSIELNGYAFPLVLSSLFFPVLAVSTDVLNEFYGDKHAKTLLYGEIITQLLMYVLMFWFVELPAVTIENHDAFISNFGLATKGFIASVASMFACNFADIYVFTKLRKLTFNKHLWSRVFGSTILSLLLDIVIYTSIVFGGTRGWTEIFRMMLISALVRTTFCFLEIPTLYFFRWLKKKNIFVVDEDSVEDSVKELQSMEVNNGRHK